MKIDDILAVGEKKLTSKDGKKALEFLRKHKTELEGLGEDLFLRLIAWVGVGEPEKAKDLFLIQYQSAQQLIDGISASGEVFKKAHKQMIDNAEKASKMWQSLGEGAAKTLLPLLISMI